MPERSRRFLHYLIRHERLTGYGKMEGLHEVFLGMAGRARFPSNMERATGFLEKHYEAFGAEFGRFFPELEKYCEGLLGDRA
jgi:acyl carrier protein phosphodiesterase